MSSIFTATYGQITHWRIIHGRITRGRILILAWSLSFLGGGIAQAQDLNPDAPPQTAQLDFMIGTWDLETRDVVSDGSYRDGRATSTVYYILDGYAIQDDYRVLNGSGEVVFRGTSIRSFNPQKGKWQITWVMANVAGITDIEAEFRDGELVMTGEGYDRNGEFLERAVYSDISDDHYSFRLDRSYDGGETWISPFGTIEATRPGNTRAPNTRHNTNENE